jgi:hypothetical protein
MNILPLPSVWKKTEAARSSEKVCIYLQNYMASHAKHHNLNTHSGGKFILQMYFYCNFSRHNNTQVFFHVTRLFALQICISTGIIISEIDLQIVESIGPSR